MNHTIHVDENDVVNLMLIAQNKSYAAVDRLTAALIVIDAYKERVSELTPETETFSNSVFVSTEVYNFKGDVRVKFLRDIGNLKSVAVVINSSIAENLCRQLALNLGKDEDEK